MEEKKTDYSLIFTAGAITHSFEEAAAQRLEKRLLKRVSRRYEKVYRKLQEEQRQQH